LAKQHAHFFASALAVSAAMFATGVMREVWSGLDRFLCCGLIETAFLFVCDLIEEQWGGGARTPDAARGGSVQFAYRTCHIGDRDKDRTVERTFSPAGSPVASQGLFVVKSLAAGLVAERPLHAFVLRHGGRLMQGARLLRMKRQVVE
jgi:hypothetical protein